MEVKVFINKNYARVQLNRPDKLNALSYQMMKDLDGIFRELEANEEVHFILFEGAGERAFCAGGDIVQVYRDYIEKGNISPEFFHFEFQLDDFVSKMKTPIFVHWKGATMGGGIGISIDCDFIVADDTVKWAMPETALGIIPDVGVGYFFSQMNPAMGRYLSLTGRAISGADTRRLGLSHCYIHQEDYEKLRGELLEIDFSKDNHEIKNQVRTLLRKYDRQGEETELSKNADHIEKYFNKNSIEEILQGLKEGTDEFAKREYGHLMGLCPKSLAIVFEKYEAGKEWTRSETFQIDEAVLFDAMKDGNLSEGIRSKMIDKDHNPHYYPALLAEIDRQHIKKLLTLKK